MLNVTFDTNCVIALTKGDATAPDLPRVVDAAADRKVRLRVVAISASERHNDLARFRRQLVLAGLDKEFIEILPAPGLWWNFGYWDHMLWAGDAAEDAELREIHGILRPDHGDDLNGPGDRTAEDLEKWRNRVVDTCALWTHLRFGGGTFITDDRNFLKATKRSRLERLGTRILAPKEAATVYTRSASVP